MSFNEEVQGQVVNVDQGELDSSADFWYLRWFGRKDAA